jgi:L-methionine (R)-S-oxide reductase
VTRFLDANEVDVNDSAEIEVIFEQLLTKIEKLIAGEMPPYDKLMSICDMLKELVPHYDWVGFYLVDNEQDRELVLGPYVGDPTEHTRIPFGAGICGQAAEREDLFVVQDVSAESNYLSCSMNVKSEIVVPVFKKGKLVGELDIDSHMTGPFTEADSTFLKRVAEIAANAI